MNPRLIAVDGPLAGQSFAVGHDPYAIGHAPESHLRLEPVQVSGRHCAIHRSGERRVLRDLESRYGTFVNRLPVRERALRPGDVVTIGHHAFLFVLHDEIEEIAPAPGDASDPDLRVELRSSLAVPPVEALRRWPEKVAALAPDRRVARDFEVLLGISSAMHAARGVEELGESLLARLFQALGAERGALLLLEPGSDELTTALARDQAAGEPFRISRTVAHRVLSERRGLLCEDVEKRDDLSGAESLNAAGVRSLLCVPLLSGEKRLGALYFDNGGRGGLFDAQHLELLSAVAATASLALENVRHIEWLRSENRRLQAGDLEHAMIGESPAMKKVLKLIGRLAGADSTVLIRGESGTGKELAARAIHTNSARSGGPFVAINCATLSESLLESELFGHEKGAFTGAVAKKVGKVETAHQGTLFLDEVGEMPLALQARLLRALQEREFERVGGTRPIQVDIRVVAATNRELEEAIRQGQFREDLYYRLNVISFTMPPLRERQSDVALLARHFAVLHSRRIGRPVTGLSPEAQRALAGYGWPGNVRQLANAVERAVVLGQDELILLEDLPDEVIGSGVRTGTAEPLGDFQAAVAATKKKLITDALEAAGGNAADAARSLGLHPNSLRRLVRNLGLKPLSS